MQPFFETYLERLETLHMEIEAALEGLPQAGLDWAPGPQANSIAVLIVHLAGAERFWIGDVVMGDPSNRQRETEFTVRGLTAEALKYRLSDSRAYIRNQLAALTLRDLDEPRTLPNDTPEVSAGWALLHVLEHTALHAGQIQLTRQYWHWRQIA
jgi:uncharacterized damage-inducible protein DinB